MNRSTNSQDRFEAMVVLSLLINTCECRLSGKPTLRTICPDCLWLGGSTLEPQVDSCSNLANSSCSATFVLTREICIESLDVKLAMFGDRGPPLVDCAQGCCFSFCLAPLNSDECNSHVGLPHPLLIPLPARASSEAMFSE